MIGGFFDRYHAAWDEAGLAWFEALLEEDDADVLAWALGTAVVPDRFAGDHIATMQRIDYVRV